MNYKFYIIWPERNWVSTDQIISWYNDAVANEDIEAEDGLNSLQKAMSLSDARIITLGSFHQERLGL